MFSTALFLLILGAIGHMVLWVAAINRVHAMGIAQRWINGMTVVCLGMLVFAPVAVAAALLNHSGSDSFAARGAASVAWIYVVVCAVVCVAAAIQRWLWTRHPERAWSLLTNHTKHISLRDQRASFAGQGVFAWLCRLPGNQVLDIHVQEKEIALPSLLPAHDGVRIAHLTDLHMSGRLNRAFYEHVVKVINDAEPDIVAITGDIIEGDRFLDWLPPTIGRLRASCGVFYVLGNHDRRATESRIKAVLAESGLKHVGDNWQRVIANDSPLIIAGNELPWYKPAADLSTCPNEGQDTLPTRILLAHSPDQFKWAQANQIDLMLAGHVHGGQIRLPLMGAITSPSFHGVRYAAGVFRAGNTVMHVSRGVGALTPVRVNCPPEIAVLVLRSTTEGV